jgi:glutaredoxin
MAFIYLSWAIYLGGLFFFAFKGDYVFALFWLVWLPIVQWAYIRSFPRLSRYLGYGRVDDKLAENVSEASVKVTLYTALGCPFCPLVEKRLEELRKEMGFTLEKVDVTLKPELLTRKNIRAVPVVEVGKERMAGNATTHQLAELIMAEQQAALAQGHKNGCR